MESRIQLDPLASDGDELLQDLRADSPAPARGVNDHLVDVADRALRPKVALELQGAESDDPGKPPAIAAVEQERWRTDPVV